MEILLSIFLVGYLYFKVVQFIYLFQIKEYRLDRLWCHLKEFGFVVNIWGETKLIFPKKSTRNAIIFAIVMAFSSIMICGYYLNIELNQIISQILVITNLAQFSFINFLIWLGILPLIAFVLVGIACSISGIFVRYHREKIITKARELINSHSDTIFIGVTGSYGKTSAKDYIASILSAKFETAKTDKNHNSDIGVALSILKNLKKSTKYFVVEMGAYKKGEIKKICDLVHPKIGVITHIGNQHLGLFGSEENLIKAKLEVMDSLPSKSMIFLGSDIVENFSNRLREDLEVVNVNNSTDVEQFSLSLAKTVAEKLGISQELIESTIRKISIMPKRLIIKKNSLATIYNDMGSSTSEGILALIDKIANDEIGKIKILVTKGIIELGSAKAEVYRKIISKSKEMKVKVIANDKLFKKYDDLILFKSEEDLLQILKNRYKKDVVLGIAGRYREGFEEKLYAIYDLN